MVVVPMMAMMTMMHHSSAGRQNAQAQNGHDENPSDSLDHCVFLN